MKASHETHADVGDKANDAVRVNGRDLRAKVVGEGGNLGFTQRGRVEYALDGGRVNTDAIDNAGGVNCSDHEVNIKVLLDSVVANGDMTGKQRNALLAEMTDAVAERVLRGSYTQTQSLSLARAQAPAMLDVHDRFMRELESAGRLDRALEALPDAETVADRRTANLGLTQPELAVILAYSKITLYAALLDSDLPEDPALGAELERYFPAPLPERFGDEMAAHRLRREIVATRVTNDLVDRAGTTFVFRLRRGHRRGAGRHRARLDRRPGRVQGARAVGVTSRRWTARSRPASSTRCCSRAAGWSSGRHAGCCARARGRWTSRPRSSRYEDGARVVGDLLPAVLVESEQEAWRERVAKLTEHGVPEALAGRVAAQGALFSALDIVEVADATEHPIEEVAELHFLLGGKLHLHWLRDRIALLARDTRWAAMARAALRDDLFSLHAELTADVLRFESLDAWLEANRPAVERAQEILGEIRAGGAFDLTTLPVALREVRNLIQLRSAPA